MPVSSSSPTSTAEAALRKSVTSDYTLLRRGPRSYVIGTAYRGWTVDVQGNADSGYRWGRVFGDLNGCLWIYEGAVAGSGPATQSSSSTPQIWPTGLFTNARSVAAPMTAPTWPQSPVPDVPPTTECICSAGETCAHDGVGIQSWYFLPRDCLPATLPDPVRLVCQSPPRAVILTFWWRHAGRSL